LPIHEIFIAAIRTDEDFIVFRVQVFFGDIVKGKHEDDDTELGGRESEDQFPSG
jgi:hypothetical protein